MRTTENSRHEVIAGLRDLADLLESSEFVPVPYGLQSACGLFVCCHSPEQWSTVVKAVGAGEKDADDTFLNYYPDRFPFLQITASKNVVCEKVTIGTKLVEEKVIPQQVIPAHEEEIVEWRCKPFLGHTEAGHPVPEEEPCSIPF